MKPSGSFRLEARQRNIANDASNQQNPVMLLTQRRRIDILKRLVFDRSGSRRFCCNVLFQLRQRFSLCAIRLLRLFLLLGHYASEELKRQGKHDFLKSRMTEKKSQTRFDDSHSGISDKYVNVHLEPQK